MHSGRGEWYRWTLGTPVHSGRAQVSRRRTSDLLCSQYHHPLRHPPDCCQPCVLCPRPSPTCHWNWAIFYLPEKNNFPASCVSVLCMRGSVGSNYQCVYVLSIYGRMTLYQVRLCLLLNGWNSSSSHFSLARQGNSLMPLEVRFCHIRRVFMFLTRHDCEGHDKMSPPLSIPCELYVHWGLWCSCHWAG